VATNQQVSERSRTGGRPTLDEVAARAGVGRGTVSRVVNGSPQVSASAKAAVENAIRELGYIPNRAARALVTQRTDSVALVVSESEERVFGEPFFAGIIRGINSMLIETPFQLWLAMAQSKSERDRVEHHLTRQHVDGVLLLSLHGKDKLPQRLEDLGVPTVLSGRPLSRSRKLWYVDADNVGGGRLATSYLIESGRQHVGTVAGPGDMCAGQDRLAGYRRAVEAAGLPYEHNLVSVGDFTPTGGYDAARRLLTVRPDVDAIFAASDLAAFGVMRAISESGRQVGDDVAVIGFDDIPAAVEQHPPLSTVRQPIPELGAAMTRLLLDRIEGRDELARTTVLPVELVLRETT
jgi:DNA-binding LacI/PurR family transcriptional regulator